MEDPAARRERLKALRKAAEQSGQLDSQQQQYENATEPEKPVLKFRNYQVQDQKHIEHEKVC